MSLRIFLLSCFWVRSSLSLLLFRSLFVELSRIEIFTRNVIFFRMRIQLLRLRNRFSRTFSIIYKRSHFFITLNLLSLSLFLSLGKLILKLFKNFTFLEFLKNHVVKRRFRFKNLQILSFKERREELAFIWRVYRHIKVV